MLRILIITSIIPIESLTHKKDENDIQFVIEDNIRKRSNDIEFKYIYLQTYSNRFLGMFSKRWQEFAELCNLEEVISYKRKIIILPIFQLPKRTKIRNILLYASIKKYRTRIDLLIKEFKPDLIHAQNADSNAYMAKYIKDKYKIPYVVTLRSIFSGMDELIIDNLKNSKELVAVSPTQVNEFNNAINKKVNLIPHGIDDKFFIKNNYSINPKKIKLVVIARLIPLKNIDRVIQAITGFKNFSYDIIGDGPQRNDLQGLVKSLELTDRVRFLGRKSHDEILQLLPSYNLFIQLSYPETLGRVYFEAMAAGLPVIASKNTGVDGIVTNGKEGFLLNHYSEEELSACLESINTNPDHLIVLGENAKNLALKYKWDEISEKYIKIYTGN